MKRFIFTSIILALFLLFINISTEAAQSYTKKEIKAVAPDGFSLNATLTYPKGKQKEFQTVVLIHSLGYNSEWWGDLPERLLKNGYAVLAIDLRGHGKSIYNAKLTKTSWKKFTNKSYAKMPDDVVAILDTVRDENIKRKFFNNWAIVGSDIGASAGVIAADKYKPSPKTIVMLSPVVQTRSLYIPVHLAQLDNVDILSVSSADDLSALEAEKYLKKFAQNEFVTYTSSSKASGMVMLKNDEELTKIITEWIEQYLKVTPEEVKK